jgi:NAD(P)-dependent dehydrogenase (short-subunit alcohol dehydrogenase family)
MNTDEVNQPHLADGWDVRSIPDQTGKSFLITGGTSGLGLEVAKALVNRGGKVTITARSESKAVTAMKYSGAQDCIALDLSDLASIHSAAKLVTSTYDAVFLNAGIMAPPFTKTIDGFESQLGTNHLGHFAFAGLIKEFIGDRLVVTSSLAARFGTFGDKSIDEIRDRCRGIGRFSPWGAYGDSKLANLLFVHELERRRIRAGKGFIPLAAHPGVAKTNLAKGASGTGHFAGIASVEKFSDAIFGLISQSAERGALPLLCAATLPGINHTAFMGPSGFINLKGSPTFTHSKALAYDPALAAALWQVSEELTGITWEDSAHA